MDVVRGYRDETEEGIVGHFGVVAVVRERNAAFVAPEDVQLWPVDLFFIRRGGKDLVQRFGRAAARERDREPVLMSERRGDDAGDPFGDGVAEFVGVLVDV